ncbi:hypothetical protein GCM10027578_05880 [Spirosoma luteolum]
MYNHFLITRFNVRNKAWLTDKNQNTVKTDDWLQNRFALFDAYCFPSVQSNATRSPFTWLVFFDVQTPEPFRERIRQYQARFPAFQPVFIQDMDELTDAIKTTIAAQVDDQTTGIITTRIDNDDMLHTDALHTIRTFVESHPIESGLVDMTRGLCMQVEPELKVSACIYYSSPFISYVEPYRGRDALKTVMHRPHHKWFYRTPTFELTGKPLWIQLIHAKNMANQMQGRIVTDPAALSGFTLGRTLPALANSPSAVFRTNYLLYPFYRLKKVAKKLYLALDAQLEFIKQQPATR